MGGRRRLRLYYRTTVAVASSVPAARRRRLRWTGFHALLFLGGSRLLLGHRSPEEPSMSQLVQLIGAYSLLVVSTFYDGVPRSVRPAAAAAAAAQGLDGVLFGGRFVSASDADD